MKKIGTRTVVWVLALMALCFVLPMGALALDGDDQQATESTQTMQEQTESSSASVESSSAAAEEAEGTESGSATSVGTKSGGIVSSLLGGLNDNPTVAGLLGGHGGGGHGGGGYGPKPDPKPDPKPQGKINVTVTITNAKTDGAPFKLGETINYSITVQNNGNVPIANVVVKDELTGLEETIDSLAVDAKKTFTTSYTVQEADLGSGDYGKVTNTVTASGTAPNIAGNLTATSSIDAKTSIRLVITANDSTVPYDGEPHGEDGYTVTGLKGGHGLTVTIDGTATDVGTYPDLLVPANAVITEGGKDVTSHYEITYVPGTLVIEGSPIEEFVTLTPTDVEETYDGKAHAAGTATAVDSNGNELKIEYSADGESWTTDPSAITATKVSDSKTVQVRVSSLKYSGYVTGEQQLTINKRPVTFTGETNTVTYNRQEQSITGITPDGLASGHESSGLTYCAKGTNAGDYEGAFDGDVVIKDAAGKDVTANYKITKTAGALTISPVTAQVTVTITGNSATYIYDGEQHSVENYKAVSDNGLYTEADFSFNGTDTATGTDAGTYYMGLESGQYTNGNKNFTNVKFEVEDGCLTIVERGVYVTIAGNTKTTTYDGTEQSVEGWNVTSCEVATVEGQTTPWFDESDIACNPEKAVASGIDVGTYPMGFGSGNFYSENPNFTAMVTYTDGSLTIAPRNVTVNVAGDSLDTTYDGDEKSITGFTPGAIEVEEIEGLATPLYTDADYSMKKGVTAEVTRTNAGTYYMGLTKDDFVNNNDNFNATFKVTDGVLNIAPRAVDVYVAGNAGVLFYDATEQSVEGWDVASYEVSQIAEVRLPDFDESSVRLKDGTAKASGTEVGEYPMGLTPESFECTDTNFDATFHVTDGSLTIQPLPVKVGITGDKRTEVYDGTEHELSSWGIDYVVALEGVEPGEADGPYLEIFDTSSVECEGGIVTATEVGEYPMGLTPELFYCTDPNFTCEFDVTDGMLTIVAADEEDGDDKGGKPKKDDADEESGESSGTPKTADAADLALPVALMAGAAAAAMAARSRRREN